MHRFFIEVSYLGTNYAGFQVQKNAQTIQGEVELALSTFFREPFELTGSSRTDAGVHARQNFFHFDSTIPEKALIHSIYNLNALLPAAIGIRFLTKVSGHAHSRFDASSRLYHYNIHQFKNPFLNAVSYYFPFPLDFDLLQQAATIVLQQTNFTSFAKKNTQVNNHNCQVYTSRWLTHNDGSLTYEVQANRFLRGMVKGLTGTMLKVGRGKMGLEDFFSVFKSLDNQRVDFSPPGLGLCLMQVNYRKSGVSVDTHPNANE